MTSPVDTSVKVFRSDMANAPVLNGTAGSLIALLDAALVTGFDIKPITSLSVAGGVATVTFTGTYSAMLDSVIFVAGITGALAALNGEQKVTARPTANTLTFSTALADGVATGTVTIKMAPVGLLKPFAGTNLGTYQSADPASTKCLLRVDDTGTTSARVVGYTSMGDINTGTDPFPTAAQMAGGGHWAKSTGGGTTPIRWLLAGDGRFFMFWCTAGMSSSTTYLSGVLRGFGDINVLRPAGDAYGCILNCGASVNDYAGAMDYGNVAQTMSPRDYPGLGSAVAQVSVPYSGGISLMSGCDNAMGPFPSPVDGVLRLSRRYVSVQTSNVPRGDVPGLYSVPQSGASAVFSFGNVAPGTGPLAGRNLVAVNSGTSYSTSGVGNVGVTFIDQTGPWR